MAKPKNTPVTNNYKLTEFFAGRSGPPSSQPQPQPSPRSSNYQPQVAPGTPKALEPVSMAKTPASARAKALSLSKARAIPKQSPSSQRTVKKENAPPSSKLQDPEVISISSTSDAPTHISISSDTQTHISITTTVFTSNSVIEISPPSRGDPKVKQERQHLGTVGFVPSPAKRRRSPRLQPETATALSKTPLKLEPTDSSCFASGSQRPSTMQRKAEKRSSRKRKRIVSDDEAVNLDGVEEVVYATSKPVQSAVKVDLATPAPSITKSRSGSSKKRARMNGAFKEDPAADCATDDEIVIPSSQSDENELSLSRKSRKYRKEVEESVLAWQANSQLGVPLQTDDNGWNADIEDVFTDTDAHFGFEVSSSSSAPGSRPKTPTSAKRGCGVVLGGDEQRGDTTSSIDHRTSRPPTPLHIDYAFPASLNKQSSPSTPRRNSQLQTPRQSSPIPKHPVSVSTSRLEISTVQRFDDRKFDSPQLDSSASSLTKVDLPIRNGTRTPSPKLVAAVESSPGKKSTAGAAVPEIQVLPAMDEKAKTAAIIERIKAEAFAASSPPDDEGEGGELGSLSDSDSELGNVPDDLFARLAEGRRSAKAAKTRTSTSTNLATMESSSPLTDIDELERRSSKHANQGTRRPVSPTPSMPVTRRMRRPTNKLPTTITASAPPRKKSTVNPIVKLLKEKAEEEKLAPLRKCLLGFKLDTTDEEDTESDEYKKRASGSKARRRLTSPQISDEDDMESIMDESDRRRLFGEDDGNAIGRILEGDRLERGKGKAVSPLTGVPFWEEPSAMNMDVDGAEFVFPSLKNAGKGAIMDLLRCYIGAKDVNGTALILGSAMFTLSGFPLTTGFLTWLFNIAISSPVHLAHSASTLLQQICGSHPDAKNTPVSTSPVLEALGRLGARVEVLEALGLSVPHCFPAPTSGERRLEMIRQLSVLINLFAKEKMLDPSEVPSCVSLLISIGMDIRTDLEHKLSIAASVNTLCVSYCAEFTMERGEMELSICSSILRLTKNLSPTNKEYLLTFLSGGGLVARRIAQWIGFAMLTDDFGAQLACEYTSGAPALSHVIALLDPGSSDELQSNFFDLRRSAKQNDDFDYIALGHHVEVLARVLMNIPQYVEFERLEREATASASFTSVNTDGSEGSMKCKSAQEKPKLETIKSLLERLGNKIVDTRAAHLDRSRTKATIQRLTMRVYYQYQAALSCHEEPGRPRARNLDAFFKRPKP